MVRSVMFRKNIAVLESYWDLDAEEKLSVGPLFKFLSKRDGVRYVTLTSGTVEEFRFNLEIVKTIKKGGILFLGFHGFPGGIHLISQKVTMEDISNWLGKGFGRKKDWIVFFDSCRTLKVEKERIQDFMANTGVKTVIGFTKSVDLIDAGAVGLLLINWLQFYVNMPRLWERFQKDHSDLVKMTGLTVHFNGHRA